MRLAAVAAAAVAAVLLAPGLARADGSYFSFGVGSTSVEDELAARTGDGARIRLALGHRLGNLAFEGFVAPEIFDDTYTDGVGVGIDARYLLPISRGLQVYVRGSMSRLSVTLDDARPYADTGWGASRDYAGRGLGGGVGVQLRGRVRALGFLYWPFFFLPLGPKTNAALFIDHGYDFYRLHPQDERGGGALDARVTRLTVGFNVGADF